MTMGMQGDIATEHVVRNVAGEIKRLIEENQDKPDVLVALKVAGNFALTQLDTDPGWEATFKEVFSLPPPKELDLSPAEFFTRERFEAIGASPKTITSAINGVLAMAEQNQTNGEMHNLPTMKDFLRQYTQRYPFTRVIGMGGKAVEAIVAVLHKARMPFKYEY